MVSSSGTIDHGIYGPFYSFATIEPSQMNESTSSVRKKAVLVRIPPRMYEDLLNLSAAATLLQRKSVSVPSLVVEILDEALRKRPLR
jgi:hypothetical protein